MEKKNQWVGELDMAFVLMELSTGGVVMDVNHMLICDDMKEG